MGLARFLFVWAAPRICPLRVAEFGKVNRYEASGSLMAEKQ